MNSAITRITFLLILTLTAGRILQASGGCTNASLQGTFAEIGWGAIPTPVIPGLAGPFVRVGQTIADGNGTVVSHTAASFNGLIFQVESYSGAYTVNSDCTIVFNMEIPIPIPGTSPLQSFILPVDLNGVISADGVEVSNVIYSPPGLSIRILFHKLDNGDADKNAQRYGTCPYAPLGDGFGEGVLTPFQGAFGLDMFGSIAPDAPSTLISQDILQGSLSRNGRVVFDGSGNFTANSNVNYNGTPVTETLNGTYSIDAGCKITMVYTDPDSDIQYTWFGGLGYGGNEATLMVTSPSGSPNGVAVVGTLTRQ